MNIRLKKMKPALLASAGIAAFAVTSWSADELVVDGDLMVNGDAMVEQSLQTAGADGVLFTGEFGTGQLLTTGAGTRFMWYPLKGAVRGGLVTDTHWDDNTGWNPIGDYSLHGGVIRRLVENIPFRSGTGAGRNRIIPSPSASARWRPREARSP